MRCSLPFHNQIMKSWNELYNKTELNKTSEILDQNLLYNQLIKIDNKHITGTYLGSDNAHFKSIKGQGYYRQKRENPQFRLSQQIAKHTS